MKNVSRRIKIFYPKLGGIEFLCVCIRELKKLWEVKEVKGQMMM